MRRVCAVIVTYNRAELLCRCVSALLKQNFELDILIYDNHSTVDTKQALMDNGLLCDNVFYFYASENSGGAGGFHNGMKMAMEKGYDDLLLMDDDGYAINEDTVRELIDVRERVGDFAIVNSLVICDSETLQLSFSVDRGYDGKAIQERAEDGVFAGCINPFNGTLISSQVVEKIGYTRKEYFVYGDENEYTIRAKKNGVYLCTAVNSLYYHPTNITGMKKFLGYYFPVQDIPMWKLYCASRNKANYMKQYYKWPAVAKFVLRMYSGLLFTKKKRIQKFKCMRRGMKDGFKGYFDRELDFSR